MGRFVPITYQESTRLRPFEGLFDQLFYSSSLSADRSQVAPVDVRSDGDNVYVSVEVPGLSKSDLDLSFEEGVLTIKGEKKPRFYDQEFWFGDGSYGEFERRLKIGTVDFEQAKARLNDGCLAITIPKQGYDKRQTLDIS